MQHFQRARGDARRAPCNKLQRAIVCTPQRVARAPASRCWRSCFGTRPRDPMRFAASLALAACFLHGFARVCDARATDWDASRVIHGRTLLCTAVNYADPILQRVLSTFGCFAARARLKLTSKVRVPLRQRCVFVQVCSDHVSGGRGVRTRGGAWGCPGAVDANGTANILPPSPLQRRRRGASSEFIC